MKIQILTAGEQIPFADIHVVQVDERAVPMDDADRNFTRLKTARNPR